MKSNFLITGASGTGTSTLGELLAEQLGVSFFDLDDFYWSPEEPRYSVKRPFKEREALLLEATNSLSGWVISGSILNWGQFLIPSICLVVFLTVPTAERLKRIGQREADRFGEKAISEGGERYQIFQDFLSWSASYDKGDQPGRSRALHEKWLNSLDCRVLKIDGIQSNEERIQIILDYIAHAKVEV